MRFGFRMAYPRWLGLLFTFILVGLVATATAEAAGEAQNTYIEFIFDSSLSMRDRIDDGFSRMAVAKEVMRDLIGSLEDQPGLKIALRVYGSQTIDELACRDSKLLQTFGSVDEVRGSILQIVESLEPRGRTPIGYSLQLAAEDFPMNPGDRNIIVLITDGQESCGIDPCVVSNELQAKGIIMRPYVVGFAMSAQEEATVRCIGEYYRATDRDSLSEALRSIMVKAIAPPSLEIEAYGGGVSVLNDTRIEILDSSGSSVYDDRPSTVQTLRVSLDEGVYTVTGHLSVGLDTVVASQSGVVLQEGETAKVRLDFGSLRGSLRVTARASDRDVSGQVDVQVYQSGSLVQTDISGVPPSATLSAGDYVIKVTHRNYPSLTAQQMVHISPEKQTSVSFDLGELPARLEVTVQLMGKDVTSQCELSIASDGLIAREYGTGTSVFRYEGNPGQVELRLAYIGDVRTEKVVSGTVLRGGETTRVTIDLSDLLGVIRATVIAGEADVTADSRVRLDGSKATLELPQRGAYREAVVPAGFYGLKAFGRTGYESNTAEIDVVAGKVTTVALRLNVPGTIVVKPTVGGRPLSLSKASAWVYRDDRALKEFDLIEDSLVVTVDPGTYDVVCTYPSIPEQTRSVTSVSVGPGMTKETAVDFSDTGILEVSVIAADRPLDRVLVEVYQGEQRLSLMEATGRPGSFRNEVVAGKYDLLAIPESESFEQQWVHGVEVLGSTLVEKRIVLSAATRIRINAVMDGKPTSQVRLYLYEAGQKEEWVEIPGIAGQEGAFELDVKAGAYDLLVSPDLSGFSDRWIRGLVVPAGDSLERQVQIGGSGLLRVRVMLDGRPTTKARLFLHQAGSAGTYFEMLYQEDRESYELAVAEGVWDLEVCPEVSGVKTKWVKGLEVWGGETLTEEVSIGAKGTVRVTVLLDGKPAPGARAFLYSSLAEGEYYEMYSVEDSPGEFVLDVAEGTWDLEIMPPIDSVPYKWVKGIEVTGGEVLSQSVSLGGKGTLRVTTLINGKPDERVRVFVHAVSDPDDWYEMAPDESSPGVLVLEIAEGTWDLEIVPEVDSIPTKWVRGIEIRGGQVTNEQVSVGGAGKLRIKVMYQGRSLTDEINVIAEDPETYDYWWLEPVGAGVFAADLAEGTYDVSVSAPMDGIDLQWFKNIDVIGGQTVDKTLTLVGPGTLRIRLTADDDIFEDAYVYLEDERDWVADFEWNDEGQFFEVTVTAGVYRLTIEPYYDYETVTYSGVEVKEGQTLQSSVTLRPTD